MKINFVPVVVPEREVAITITERQARLLSAFLGGISPKEFADSTNRSIDRYHLKLRKITDPSLREDNVSAMIYNLISDL